MERAVTAAKAGWSVSGTGKSIKLCLAFLTAGYALCQTAPIPVCAEEIAYPVLYEEKPESVAPVMELTEKGREYTVLPGDCLWNIADKLWGSGNRYQELVAANAEVIEDPDLIYPGMLLQTGRKGYIIRTEAHRGGFRTGKYSMDLPGGWSVGCLESGEAFSNLTLSGEGMIVCLIQDKMEATTASAQDWEECSRQIRDYVEENYAGSVQDLTFEQYQMGDGGELYLYDYIYQIDLADHGMEGKLEWNVCVGLKLTDHIQAEFIGFSTDDYDIQGCVRYVTASFEEYFGEDEEGAFTVNDSNMALLPSAEWEIGGMFDPFPWVEEYFSAFLEKATGSSGNQYHEIIEKLRGKPLKQR